MLNYSMTQSYPGGKEKKEIPLSHLRCAKCKKLLAKPNVQGKIAAQIKCPRCGTINEI